MSSVPSRSSIGKTAPDLLDRVKAGDAAAWDRLANLYGPLIYGWARRFGLQPSDAADITQNVFRKVFANIAGFRHDPHQGGFRGWLWTITRNQTNDHFRTRQKNPQGQGGTDAREVLENLADPQAESQGSFSAPQDRARLVHRALALIQVEFRESTWQAFSRMVMQGEDATEVALDLGVSVWSVYQAKSRVLRRLREELGDLLAE